MLLFKCAQVTRKLCGLQASTIDIELCMKHTAVAGRPNPVAIMTKHIDDLNMAGVREEIVSIRQQLEKALGKFEIEWNNFTNCGARHIQNKVTTAIALDQI